jgi:hypothetical protein
MKDLQSREHYTQFCGAEKPYSMPKVASRPMSDIVFPRSMAFVYDVVSLDQLNGGKRATRKDSESGNPGWRKRLLMEQARPTLRLKARPFRKTEELN